MYVYADVLFLLNLVMNAFVLYLTAQAAGCRYQWRRLLLAASVAGIYAALMPLAELSLLYVMPVKVAASALFVWLALGFRTIRNFLFTVSVFYVVSFIVGGAVIGWVFFVESHDWLMPGASWRISWTHVLGGVIIASVLLALVGRSMMSKVNRQEGLYLVTIFYRNRQVTVTALLDSGNRLLSPLSKRPVMLVEATSVFPVLGEKVKTFLQSTPAQAWLTDLVQCRDQDWLGRVEPVPCQSVGSRSLLVGFRPDRIIIAAGNRKLETGIAVVGLYQGELSTDGAYTALLHPLLLEGEIIRRRDCANQVANY